MEVEKAAGRVPLNSAPAAASNLALFRNHVAIGGTTHPSPRPVAGAKVKRKSRAHKGLGKEK